MTNRELLNNGWFRVGRRRLHGYPIADLWDHPTIQREVTESGDRFYTTKEAKDKQKYLNNPAKYPDPDYVYPPLADDEYRGINTEGDIDSKNGKPFTIPSTRLLDCREYLAVDDIVGYKDSPRKYRITYVDKYTVQMRREPDEITTTN